MKKEIKVNLKRKADVTKDNYLQGFLDQINKAQIDAEKLTILGSIYSNGFEDGANEEKKTELHVVIGVFSGVLTDVAVFSNKEDADDHEKRLCKEYEVPYDKEERELYYLGGMHVIKHLIKELH